MLDHVSILTQGGLVLWQKSFTPSPAPFDALIREALIEQRATTSGTTSGDDVSRWDKDAHSLLWLLANDLDLVFCVAYQRILALPYVADLLHATRDAFLKPYRNAIHAIVASTSGKDTDALRTGPSPAARAIFGREADAAWSKAFKGWDDTFNRILREFEASSSRIRTRSRTAALAEAQHASSPSSSATPALTTGDSEALDAQAIARNIAALKARQKAAGKAGGGRGRKSVGGTDSEGGGGASESDATPTKGASRRKAATKWGDSPLTESDLAAYDYSSDSIVPPGTPGAKGDEREVDTSELVSKGALGRRDNKSGLYEVADYKVGAGADDDDDDLEEDVGDDAADSAATVTGGGGALSSFFSRLSLTSRDRALTASDLAPTIAAMQQHLMSKNVARDIAEQIVANVGKSLEGKKISSGSGIGGTLFGDRAGKKAVRDALQEALVRILTPKTSTDLLLEIQRKRSASSVAAAGTAVSADPYAITFVGVNGVGKSTNLSKVAFWLLQNRLRILIAACDTFRSGAVEQLRVHVRNLGKLEEELGGGAQDGKSRVELFEKGYGKDAAGIAKDALAHAKLNGFDVVLIDTAGRMQDNEPLMRALAKLIAVNQPDKIIFVGEALVGNEAVDQLTKFNRSLRDFSARGGGAANSKGKGEGRGVDGMILTKFDTIDDKVGAALSMTYVTGQPIYFVGTGQTYSDLRMLRVGHIVQALLQN
ncbi:hypothetical protein BMF94_2708 [Rhodotorula taiwanensis]|uniref:SRP54-type proteins GTP-binding domain-containing protein n=1 Tax=Rhodotorula taiwanensis TaxID=741276 RepID=A0A2S5BBX7_9BASI|nr:hypothetical protein BMF94_2708 [Rhodotorula taiwanensis]